MNPFRNKGKMLFYHKCRGLCSIIIAPSRDHQGMTALLTGHFWVRPWTAERELLGKQMILFSILAPASVLCSCVIYCSSTDVQALFWSVLKTNQRAKSSFSHNTQDHQSNRISSSLLSFAQHQKLVFWCISLYSLESFIWLSLSVTVLKYLACTECICLWFLNFFGLDHSYFKNKLRYLHAL